MSTFVHVATRLAAGGAGPLAALPMAWAPPAAAGNLVQNGDFSLTSLSSPGGFVCQLGTTCVSDVTDWGSACSSQGSCGNGGTPMSLLFPGTNGVAFNNHNGMNAWVDAPGTGNVIADDGDPAYQAPLFQTINGLTAGQSYTLTFDQAAAEQGGFHTDTTEYWQVSLGGETQDSTLMTTPGGTFHPWSSQALVFTATSTSEVLNFLSEGTPAGEPPVALLANVSLISNVPEPAAWGLMLVGSLAVGASLRRRLQRRAEAV